ncbi:MAG: formylmethanofuran dehydrogenase subunit A, partial [Methylococcales bacterium]
MIIKLTGGVVYDPANNVNGKALDIYIKNDRIVSKQEVTQVDQEIDLRGKIVMAGAIDMHTHVGGGKNNIARILLPEDHR